MYEVAREFLSAVLAEQPRYVGAIQRHGRRGLWQNYFPTIDALAHWLVNEDGPGKEVYYALGSFGEVDSREAVNVHTLKSFWVDMDCGEGKAYPDRAAAQQHLEAFLDKGFPDFSYLVKSGHGLHAYWVLDRSCPKSQWLIAAQAFQAAWQAFGLKADPVTADAARVLRCPGTHNYKFGGRATVEVLESTGELHQVASVLEAAQRLAPSAPQRNAAMSALDSNEDLFSGLSHRKAYILPIVQKCRQVGLIARNKGADCSEPLWYATVQLARHLENGAQVAHFLSSGHPGYSESGVDAKLEQLEARDIGPTTCEKFRSLNPIGCEGCQFQITSPIQLGEKEREAIVPKIVVAEVVQTDEGETVVEQELSPPVGPPNGYRFTSEGVEVEIKDPKGLSRWHNVFAGALFPTRLHRAPGGYQEVEVYYQRYGTKEHGHFSLGADHLGELKETRGHIMRETMINATDATFIQKMINSMAYDIANRERVVPAARQLGWQLGNPQTKEHFVFGNTRFSPVGAEHNVPISEILEEYCRPLCVRDGSLEGSLRGAAMFNRPGAEMHQAVYLTGLAGVFAPFTGAQNFAVLSLVSRIGGEGKTTNCDAAMAHWFNPLLSRSNPRDTQNATYNTMSMRGTLPVFIDEVTNTKADIAVELIYTASQGREKARMEQSGLRQREPLPPWKCPVLVTSNMSIKQLVRASRGDASALDARVVEMHYHRLDLTTEERMDIGRVFYENYGWTGPAVAHHVATNLDYYRGASERVRAALTNALGWDGSDRFWLNWATAVVLACSAMNALNFVSYDVKALSVYLIQLLRQQRAHKQAELRTAADILAEFLAENSGRVVVGYRTGEHQGAVRFAAFTPNSNSTLVGRSQLDENVLYVAANAMRDFCTQRGYDFRSFEAEAKEQGLLTNTRTVTRNGREVQEPGVPMTYSLGRNTPLASAPVRCLPFSLHHISLREHRDEARMAVQSQNGKTTFTDGAAA